MGITAALSFVDAGSVTPSGALPTENTSGPAPVAWDSADVQMGQSSLQVQYSGSGDAAQATTLTLIKNIDLSRFIAGGEISLWIKASDWANVEPNEPWLTFAVDAFDYFTATLATFATDGDRAAQQRLGVVAMAHLAFAVHRNRHSELGSNLLNCGEPMGTWIRHDRHQR